MRLFYDVSLKAGVEEKLANPDAQLKAYIDANKDENHQVHFLSNKYVQNSADAESGGVGAYAKFEPAETNDFYYLQNDTALYTDEECKTPQQAVLILPEQRHIIIRGIITYWVMMGKQSAEQIL